MEDLTREFFRLLNKDLSTTNYHKFKEKRIIVCKETGEKYKTQKEVMQEFKVTRYRLKKALDEGKQVNGFSFEYIQEPNAKCSVGQPNTLESMYKDGARKRVNVFFAVNDFETQIGFYGGLWENRKECKVRRFNAFFADIDFKMEDGKTHLRIDEVQEKKQDVYDKLMGLPLQPSAIIESRNGYHVYYIIDKDKRPKVTRKNVQHWKEQEQGLIKYLSENISHYVDPAVCDVARFLRCPESIHHKSDSQPFEVKVKCVNRAYEIRELKKLFPPVKEEFKFIDDGREKSSTISSNTNNNNNTDGLSISNDVLKNIQCGNIDYFNNVDKINKSLGWKESLRFFKSVNLIEFLGLGVKLKESFNSFLRKDDKASMAIYRQTNEEGYFCKDFATNKCYDLIDVVREVADLSFVDSMEFLAKVFGITIVKAYEQEKVDILPLIKNNLAVLNQVGNIKEVKYVGKLIPLYEQIMNIWQKITEERNIKNPWETNLMLGCEFLSKSVKLYIGDVSKYLKIMEALKILRPTIIKHEFSDKKLKKVNVYYVNKLDFDDLEKESKRLKLFFKEESKSGKKLNPLRDITNERLYKYMFNIALIA